MQSGCNRRSGATPLARLQRTFERALTGSEGEVCFSSHLCIPDPLLGSALRRLLPRLMKHISFLFYPSVSLTQTRLLLFPGPFLNSLSEERGWIFPPIFVPAKTLAIKDAHINESVTFLYIYCKCHNIPL